MEVGTREVGCVRRALGHGDVTRVGDEASELLVGDGVHVDPQVLDCDGADGPFLGVEVGAAHKEPTTGDATAIPAWVTESLDTPPP